MPDPAPQAPEPQSRAPFPAALSDGIRWEGALLAFVPAAVPWLLEHAWTRSDFRRVSEGFLDDFQLGGIVAHSASAIAALVSGTAVCLVVCLASGRRGLSLGVLRRAPWAPLAVSTLLYLAGLVFERYGKNEGQDSPLFVPIPLLLNTAFLVVAPPLVARRLLSRELDPVPMGFVRSVPDAALTLAALAGAAQWGACFATIYLGVTAKSVPWLRASLWFLWIAGTLAGAWLTVVGQDWLIRRIVRAARLTPPPRDPPPRSPGC